VRKLLAVFLIVLWAWTGGAGGVPPQGQDVSFLEENLLEWINKERTGRRLPPLKLSPELRTVAIGHSKDMSSRGRLTHLSSTGKSYLDRLVDSGLHFIEIGENVATSETYIGEFIHRGFMESPEHRDNILNANFDTVGIGVAYSKGKKYYITQDFFQSLNVLDADEAEILIKGKINKIREENTLAPLSYTKMADTYARSYSLKKATGQPQLNISNFFGETHIHFLITPELAITESVARRIASPVYESGGVGAWFGQLDDYPGGTYIITLFLFPKSPYEGLEEKDFSEIVLEAINAEREERGLVPLKLDTLSSRHASDLSRQIRDNESGAFVLPERLMNRQVLTYVTENLHVWPANLNHALTNPTIRRIGIGISFRENKETKKTTLWVTLIL
jgi:uncharacterized protein YkwD